MYLTKGTCAGDNGIDLNTFQGASNGDESTETISVVNKPVEHVTSLSGGGRKQWGD